MRAAPQRLWKLPDDELGKGILEKHDATVEQLARPHVGDNTNAQAWGQECGLSPPGVEGHTNARAPPSHRNRPLPELRLIKLSIDQHRLSAPGDPHRFREHGRGVLRLLEQKAAA